MLPTVMIKVDRSQQEIKYLGIANICGGERGAWESIQYFSFFTLSPYEGKML